MIREQFLISLNVFKKHHQFTLLYLFFAHFYLCTHFFISADISKISAQKFISYTRQDILIIMFPI